MLPLGFSTASFVPQLHLPTREAIAVCRDLGCPVIELSGSDADRVAQLPDITPADVAAFSFISLHAPATWMAQLTAVQRHEVFKTIEATCQRLNIKAVVVHHNAWLGDYQMLLPYDMPISIENMDKENTIGTTPAQMQSILAKGDFAMTLDINHCYTHDPTMRLAHDFYNAFQDKISHYQVSDYAGVAVGVRHTAFMEHHHDIMLRNIPDLTLPMILEENFARVEDTERELTYVKNILTQSYDTPAENR